MINFINFIVWILLLILFLIIAYNLISVVTSFNLSKSLKSSKPFKLPQIIQYYLSPDFTKPEQELIADTLNDHRSWNHEFKQTLDQTQSFVNMYKYTRQKIKEKFPELVGLSVCEYLKTPRMIYFDIQNWNSPPKNFTGDRKTYRQYLINHEMGHALGHMHSTLENIKKEDFCPVMYQQTKGTNQCQANQWPIKSENV
jgi:predicted metalloprotease